jgi:hypothetical protein
MSTADPMDSSNFASASAQGTETSFSATGSRDATPTSEAPARPPLERLSGASMAVGGSLATAAFVFLAIVDPTRAGHAEPWWVPVNLALMFGGIFMALGLPGFHARQAVRTGWLGVAGIVLFFVGILVAYVAVQTLEAMTTPAVPAGIRTLAGIGAPSLFLGGVITAFVTLRAGIYPRAIGIALFMSMMLGLLTRLVEMPPWLGMAMMATVFTGTMACLGVVLAIAPEDRSEAADRHT